MIAALSRAFGGDGKSTPEEWTRADDGCSKASSGGHASSEVDAAMVASKVGWWRQPWTDYGRRGGDILCVFCVVA